MWKTSVQCLQPVRRHARLLLKLKFLKGISKQGGYTGARLFHLWAWTKDKQILALTELKKRDLPGPIITAAFTDPHGWKQQLHFRVTKGGHCEWCPLYSLLQSHAHTRDSSWNLFPRPHNPLSSSCPALLSPQVLPAQCAFGSCSSLDACSVRLYQIVGFWGFFPYH